MGIFSDSITLTDTAIVDTDGDTICDEQEIIDGTDPNNGSNVGGTPLSSDCDGDGNARYRS